MFGNCNSYDNLCCAGTNTNTANNLRHKHCKNTAIHTHVDNTCRKNVKLEQNKKINNIE